MSAEYLVTPLIDSAKLSLISAEGIAEVRVLKRQHSKVSRNYSMRAVSNQS
jgi:hypothetical protein